MSAGQIPTLFWRDWSVNWPLDAVCALVLAGYLGAAGRVGRGWPPWRTLAFVAGTGFAVVGLQSGIDAYQNRLLSDHMVQHLLLLELAPLLLLIGRPWTLLVRAGLRVPPALAPVLSAARRLTRPLWCLAFFWAVVLGTHLPWFFDRAVTHPALLGVEHALYLFGGLMMWWPIHDSDSAAGHGLDGFGRLGYVVVAMLPMEVIGAYLNRDPTLFYTVYAHPAHLLGISAATDQQVAGGIMWVFGSSLMAASGLWQAMAALNDEEQRLRSVEELLDARSKDGTGPA